MTREAQRVYVRNLYQARRQHGLCIQCGVMPATCGGRCETHAAQQRRRTRQWWRTAHGAQPQYLYHRESQPVRYATESNAEAWEWSDGRYRKVWVEWRDPLTILLQKEAWGAWVWRVA